MKIDTSTKLTLPLGLIVTVLAIVSSGCISGAVAVWAIRHDVTSNTARIDAVAPVASQAALDNAIQTINLTALEKETAKNDAARDTFNTQLILILERLSRMEGTLSNISAASGVALPGDKPK